LYVSYFFWRLMQYDHARALHAMGMDFVQWHQKYFWEAMHLPGIGARDYVVFGLAVYSGTRVASKILLEAICRRLIDLYNDQLKPLVRFVTEGFGGPGVVLSPAEDFVKRFFVSPASLKRLKRLAMQYVREDDFDSALSTYGVHAMLWRVMRLCNVELKPLLRSLSRAWTTLETDRVRIKNEGLTMRSASVILTLCRLLSPPVDLPQDKVAANAVMRGPRCSVWNAVLAQRELGAFTNKDHDSLLLGT